MKYLIEIDIERPLDTLDKEHLSQDIEELLEDGYCLVKAVKVKEQE